MHPDKVRESLCCPKCEYDVTQTLRDGRAICPECGEAVSPSTCQRMVDALPQKLRRFAYATWFSAWLAFGAGVYLDSPGVIFVGFGLSAVLVYVGWWRLERWLGGPRPARRALRPAFDSLMLSSVAFWIALYVFALVRHLF